MSPDDVLIAMTVSGIVLALADIGLAFRESLRLQSLELRRREAAGHLMEDARRREVEIAAPGE